MKIRFRVALLRYSDGSGTFTSTAETPREFAETSSDAGMKA